jgi:hypothetical protein
MLLQNRQFTLMSKMNYSHLATCKLNNNKKIATNKKIILAAIHFFADLHFDTSIKASDWWKRIRLDSSWVNKINLDGDRGTTKKTYSCKMCSYCAAQKGNAMRHVALHHVSKESGGIECNICRLVCFSPEDLEIHKGRSTCGLIKTEKN